MYLASLTGLLSIFVGLCCLLVKKIGRLAILLLYPGIMFFQYIANLATLDSGIFVYELGTTTRNIYSAQIYITFLIIFLIFLILFCPQKIRMLEDPFTQGQKMNIMKSFRQFFALVIAGSLCLSAYVMFDMMVSGVPLLSDGYITHYNYFKDYSKLPFAGTASNLLTFCALLLGVYYAISDRHRTKCVAVIATLVMLLCRIMLGFKMTGLIDVAIAFSVGAILFGTNTSRLKTTGALRVIGTLVLLAAAFLALYLNYVIRSGDAANLAQAFDLLTERIFGMGAHLWWAALADQSNGFGFFPRSDEELLSPFTLMDEFDTGVGVYGMMLRYGNPVVVTADIAGGVRFTADFITTAIFYNGYLLGSFVIISIAGLVAAFLRLFDKFVHNGEIASFFIAYYLFVPFSTYFCATGTLTTFFNVKTYLVAFVLVFVSLLDYWAKANSRRFIGNVPGSLKSHSNIEEA